MTDEEVINKIYKKIMDENAEFIQNSRDNAKEEWKKYKTYAIILIIALILIQIVGGFLRNSMMAFYVMITIFAIILYVFLMKTKKKYNSSEFKKNGEELKRRVVQEILNSFEQDLKYNQFEGIKEKVYEEANFFEKYQYYSSEDLIQGTINNNCTFEASEVWTYDKYEDSKGNTQYRTIFCGVFAKTELPKLPDFELYIKKDKDNKNFLARALTKTPIDKLKLEMDSQEFEEIFDIYTSNEIYTMQLLTADIMQLLIEFYNNMKYEITIKENKIYIRFMCGEIFAMKSLKFFDVKKESIAKYYKILKFTFKLTNKIIDLMNDTQF